MDKLKEKMNTLRVEADEATAKHEESVKTIKELEHQLSTKDQEISTLQHKNQLLEDQVDKLEEDIKGHKGTIEEHVSGATNSEALQRKIALLEEEIETNDKVLRETTEKLRQIDVKAEHFERKVSTITKERDTYEQKYEETLENYNKVKAELDDMAAQLESL